MRTLKQVLKWVMAVFYVLAGSNHFLSPDFYVRIMPPYLPWPLDLVYLSGICEAALGVLLLIPKTSTWAAWGLIALLIAVFPANLHMALHPSQFPEFASAALWGRLPLQGVLIAWAYWYTPDYRHRSRGAFMETMT